MFVLPSRRIGERVGDKDLDPERTKFRNNVDHLGVTDSRHVSLNVAPRENHGFAVTKGQDILYTARSTNPMWSFTRLPARITCG